MSLLVSGIGLTFTGFYLMLNKKFNKHPYPMIAFTCIIESLQYTNSMIQPIMCFLPLPEIWAASIKPVEMILTYFGYSHGNEPQFMYDTLRAQIVLWKVISFLVQITLVLVNSLLFLDLYLITQNPFYSVRKREKFYYFTIFVACLIAVFLIYH
jgi:hypothetical protein